MFPVSLVSSQINFPACYLVLLNSFSWSSVIVFKTGESEKLMGCSESMAESVKAGVALRRWTGRKPMFQNAKGALILPRHFFSYRLCPLYLMSSEKKKRRRRIPSIIPHVTFAAFSIPYRAWWGFPGGSVGKESACNAGYPGLIPGLGKSPGERNGNPFQYFCLENPMDRGAWWATVHVVAKSQTQLSD